MCQASKARERSLRSKFRGSLRRASVPVSNWSRWLFPTTPCRLHTTNRRLKGRLSGFGQTIMQDKILLVDDDLPLLQSIERNLAFDFDTQLAQGGEEAISIARATPSFSVALVDMRMPGMDGLETIQELRAVMNDCVFVMLTGNQDLSTAMNAINDGKVFRFLTKPCEMDEILRAISAALRQYHLVVAERELLMGTFVGSVNLLTDMIETQGFGLVDTNRIAESAISIGSQLGLKIGWQERIATRVMLLGLPTMEPQEIEDFDLLDPESKEHRALVSKITRVSANMIGKIPRMDAVAKILRLIPTTSRGSLSGDREESAAVLLQMTLYWNLITMKGFSAKEATRKIQRILPNVGSRATNALTQLNDNQDSHVVRMMQPGDLEPGMILQTDILHENGTVVVSSGRPLSQAVIDNLQDHMFDNAIPVISNSRPELMRS